MSGECERDTGMSIECEREEKSWFISGPARPGSGESLPVKGEDGERRAPSAESVRGGGGGESEERGQRGSEREREQFLEREREGERERWWGGGGRFITGTPSQTCPKRLNGQFII